MLGAALSELSAERSGSGSALITASRQVGAALRWFPTWLAERLESMSSGPPTEAFRAAEALLEDTVLLAEGHTDADLSLFRQDLAERRRPVDPPRVGQ
jgi:hypothetical protein